MENILQWNYSRVYLYDEKYCLNRYPYSIYQWWQKNQAAYQNSEQVSRQNKWSEPFKVVQMIILQSNTNKTLPFDDEPKGLF